MFDELEKRHVDKISVEIVVKIKNPL